MITDDLLDTRDPGRARTAMGITASHKALRVAAIRAELRLSGVEAESVPERFLAHFANYVGAAEHVQLVASLIGPPPKRGKFILVVGTFGGRDFWGLRARGYRVIGMNLTDDPECPPTVAADAEQVAA